uniref:Uncharacterized protein n=1 Tax=Romanomermis culicivorax TaxID=13658 RepID=A0A915J6A1_ROMCU
MDDEEADWIDDDDDANNYFASLPAPLIESKNPPSSPDNDTRLAPLFADDDDEWPLSPVTSVESNNFSLGKNKAAMGVLDNENIDMDTSFERTSTLISSTDDKTISTHTTARAISPETLTKNDASSSNNNLKLLSHACNENSVITPSFGQSCDRSNNTISYLGSEVSIIMSRKPLLEIHDTKASSWNEKRISKCKVDSINSFTEPKQALQQRCSSSSSRRLTPMAPLFLGKTYLKNYQKKNDNLSSIKNSNKRLLQQNYQRPSIRNYLKQYNGANSQSMTGRRTSFKMRITSNPIGDSSSEQNLSIYCSNINGLLTGDGQFSYRDDQMVDMSRGINRQIGGVSSLSSSSNNYFFGGFGLTAKSESDLNWDSASLGMNESQLRDYFNSLREKLIKPPSTGFGTPPPPPKLGIPPPRLGMPLPPKLAVLRLPPPPFKALISC